MSVSSFFALLILQGGDDIPFDGSSSDEPTGSTKASTVSAVQLERQVEQLHSQLLNLQLEKQLGVEVVEGKVNGEHAADASLHYSVVV